MHDVSPLHSLTRNPEIPGKLIAWCKTNSGFKYKETKWLDAAKNRSLEAATGNPSYRQFNIERIHARGLRTAGVEHVKFTNGVELTKRASTGDFASNRILV